MIVIIISQVYFILLRYLHYVQTTAACCSRCTSRDDHYRALENPLNNNIIIITMSVFTSFGFYLGASTCVRCISHNYYYYYLLTAYTPPNPDNNGWFQNRYANRCILYYLLWVKFLYFLFVHDLIMTDKETSKKKNRV